MGSRISARVVGVAARPEELPVARIARHAADRVLLPLSSGQLDGAKGDLLLDPHVAAHTLASLAPIFFADPAQDAARARLSGRRGEFASLSVTVADDPRIAGGTDRAPRDGEGTPGQRTVVVERGLLASRLTDGVAVARTGLRPTGNAVRLSWTEPPVIGVRNLHIDPSGGTSPLDLLGSVSRGYYAAVLVQRPWLDPVSDRYQIATAGYSLEKGRVSHPVAEAVLTGRISDLLRSIAATGDDLKFVPGGGGGVGSPTLLIPRYRFGV